MILFFGGGECHAHVSKLQASGATHAQLSFYYLKERRIKNPVIFDHGFKVLVSSGAPALRGNGQQDSRFYKKYFQEYLSFLDKYRDKIFAATEFDFFEMPDEATTDMRTQLQGLGIPIIYMWQKGCDWEAMCKEFDYIGIPDIDLTLAQQHMMLQVARQHKTRVHRFTPLRLDYLLKIPYYTVSNSRWIAGEKFGSLFVWRKTQMVEIKNHEKDSRKQYKSQLELLGFDWDKLMRDDPEEIGKANIVAWLELEKHVNRVSVLRQYFEFDSSKEVKDSPSVERQAAARKAAEKPKSLMKNPFTEKELQEARSRSSLLRQKATLCDNCYVAKRCQFYQPQAICQLNQEFMALSPSRNSAEVLSKLKGLLGTLEERTNKALYFETIDGGMPDKNATDLVKMLLDYNLKLHDLIKEKAKTKSSILINGDDLLGKIFAPKKDPIDVSPSVDAEILDTQP